MTQETSKPPQGTDPTDPATTPPEAQDPTPQAPTPEAPANDPPADPDPTTDDAWATDPAPQADAPETAPEAPVEAAPETPAEPAAEPTPAPAADPAPEPAAAPDPVPDAVPDSVASTPPAAPPVPPVVPPAAPSTPPVSERPTTTVNSGTQIIGTYEIESLINSGGMGEVYRGRNIHTGEPVAIKIVLPSLAHDTKIIALFQKEATVLSRLAHDAIVRYHVFTNDPTIGRPCLVMEFVAGTSLSDQLEIGPMTPEDVQVLLRRVASGLDRAHKAGVVHRDLSPDNVILHDGVVAHAKIIDFGIAKAAEIGGGTLLQGQFAGKFNFVSPEQLGAFGGAVDGRSDIYSLGLMIAAMCKGEVLEMGASIVDAVASRQSVPDLTGVPDTMVPLLTHMLEPDPANRPESMAAVIDLLDNPAAIPARDTASPPPDPNRTVITASLPPVSLPPGLQGTAPPASAPPVAPPAQVAADDGRTQISTPPQFSVPPGPQSAPQPAAEEASPFGGPDTGATPFAATAAAPDTAPKPAAKAAPAKKKGGGKGLLVVLILLLLGGGGAGLYFSGILEPGEDVAVVTPTPEPEPTPEPTPDPVPEPEPTPEPVPEPEPEPTPAPEPEPEPVPEPTPTPDPEPTPEPAPEPEPEPSPAPELSPLAEQLAWFDGYDAGPCTYVHAGAVRGTTLAPEMFATSAVPMTALLDAFTNAHGVEPEIGGRLINEPQCPILDFMTRTGATTDTPAPRLVLDNASDVLKSGQTVSGRVEGLDGRAVTLFLINGAGGANNLKDWISRSSDGTTSFSFSVRLAEGAAPAPQLILAVATDEPVTKLGLVPNGVTARALVPFMEGELATLTAPPAAALRFFRLEN